MNFLGKSSTKGWKGHSLKMSRTSFSDTLLYQTEYLESSKWENTVGLEVEMFRQFVKIDLESNVIYHKSSQTGSIRLQTRTKRDESVQRETKTSTNEI